MATTDDNKLRSLAAILGVGSLALFGATACDGDDAADDPAEDDAAVEDEGAEDDAMEDDAEEDDAVEE